MVDPARGRGVHCRRAGGVVHCSQRSQLSRLPEVRLARRAIDSLSIGLLLLVPVAVIAAVLIRKRNRARKR